MRRVVASAVLLAFVLQGTAASAAPIAGTQIVPLRTELAANLASLDLALTSAPQSRYVMALLTDSTGRYNAIHAAAPVFKRNVPQIIAPALTHISHAVQPRAVSGSRGNAPQMLALNIALQKHSDPLAMQSGAQLSPGIIRPTPHLDHMTASPTSVSGPVGGSASIAFTCSVWDGEEYEVGPCSPYSATSNDAAVATASGSEITYVGVGTTTVIFHGTETTEIAVASVTVTAATPPPPTPTPPPTATPSPLPTGLPVAVTGINRYWTYETGAIPGVGRFMVNVGTGNVLVQDDDINLPERGIDLAFRRTYDSLSAHDVNNSDGSVPSNYGNGWTNTFDAHMAYNAATNILSVYDIDGARYDYTSNGSGGWTPPPGMHNSLLYDGGCGYVWEKRGLVNSPGTQYYFYAPIGASCTSNPGNGYRGRLYEILARNVNNKITFLYSWSGGDASNPNNIASITAAHSDGQSLTLTFADFSGHRLLSSITRPDGASASFSYAANGDLTDVYDIGNNAATGATPLHHQYAYYGTGYQMNWASGPNWAEGNGGGYVAFAYDGANRADEVQGIGIMNFTPADGTNTPIAGSFPTTGAVYSTDSFSYAGSQTTFTDTDDHATDYSLDPSGRVTQTQDWNGSIWLVNNATWDSDNNLTTTVGPRGNETDYAYDADGNAIVESLPAVTTTQGNIRPTSVFAYDGNDNLVAACDANWSAAHGISGTGSASSDESACASGGGGTTRYIYDTSDSYESFGRLIESKSACVGGSCADAGVDATFTYNQSIEGGDYGLPTSVTQPCFTQYDSSQVCPQQSFGYDGLGNLTSYNKGNGAWALAYDSNNRLTSATDPDGVATRTCYFQDGSVQATQSPTQYANDGGVVCGSHSTSYTYDADGNRLTELHHYNNEAGTTTNIYDGDDRLVEVILPHDSANDYYSYAWMTRNIYDLSQGGTVSIGTQSGIKAYGNQYKTQEYLGSSGWIDLKGDGYDPMDRVVNAYSYEPVSDILEHTTKAYDQSSATYGLLASATNAVGEVTTPTYDADGKTVEAQFSNDGGVTPSETLTFDPDGRVRTVTSSSMGEQSTTYDADGKVLTVQEPSGGSLTSPATYTYTYYGNGQRAQLSASASGLLSTITLQYAYRTDGLRSKLAYAYGANTANWTWGRSNAGRTTSIADSSGQPTRTITYDAQGRTASDTMPSGESSNFQYDDEGEVLGYTTPNNDGSTATTIGYTVRGEFASQTFAGGQCGGAGSDTTLNPVETEYANGVSLGKSCDPGAPTTPAWDPRTGAMETTGGGSNSTGYSYDAAGRQTTSENPWSVSWTCGDQQCGAGATGDRARTYDAQNHLIGDTYSQWSQSGLSGCVADRVDPPHDQIDGLNGTLTYEWGPNGHADRWVGGSPGFSALTLHWDGNTPLFITDTNGTLQEVKIEGIGFYAPSASNSMTFLDRDQAGFVVASHTSSGPGLWTAANPFHQTCDGVGISGYALFEPGPDGVTDTVNTIQGVRSYDPAMGTWTTPDAYAGDATDPMSRKSYMWNRNNAFAYSDPSGYCTLFYDSNNTPKTECPKNSQAEHDELNKRIEQDNAYIDAYEGYLALGIGGFEGAIADVGAGVRSLLLAGAATEAGSASINVVKGILMPDDEPVGYSAKGARPGIRTVSKATFDDW